MNELEWLSDQRPEVPGPDDETTAYARAALLAYAVGGGEAADDRVAARNSAGTDRVPAGARRPSQATGLRIRPTHPTLLGPAVAPPQRRDHSGRRRSGARGRAGLYTVAAAVFAIAIVVVAGALPSGDDGPARQLARKIGAPAPAEAAPLVKLAKQIQGLPAPIGDATLVLRSHDFPTAKDFTGADLYLDDGRYYYGATGDELAAVGEADDLGEGVPKLEREAAVAANTLPADQARRKMIDASFGPQGEPETSPKAAAEARERILREKGVEGKLPPPAPKLTIDNNRIWLGAMDSLIAGAGDAEVRAGVMKLLSTVEAVKVIDHGATLDIVNADFVPKGYYETLTVDSRTGVIQKMVGGMAGKTPEVVVDYDITRVDAADIVPALK